MVARAVGQSFDAVFSITGSFDSNAASRVRERIGELAPVARVLFDFTHAADVSDVALVALVADLSGPPQHRALLRGLSHHQERLLQYLGTDRGVLDGGDRPTHSAHPSII